MSTARDTLKNDFHKSPEQLEREADRARTDIERTMEDLFNQLSPGELVNQAIGVFRNGSDNEFARNLVNQVRNNPVPVLLAGVSLTWLMAASKQPPVRAPYNDPMRPTRDKMAHAAHSTRSASRHLTEEAREKGHRAAEATKDAAERLTHAGKRTAESTRSGARHAQQRYQDLLNEQPLVVGALAIAAGAALGALLPPSRTEDEAVGEEAEELKHKAQQKMERGGTHTPYASGARSTPETGPAPYAEPGIRSSNGITSPGATASPPEPDPRRDHH